MRSFAAFQEQVKEQPDTGGKKKQEGWMSVVQSRAEALKPDFSLVQAHPSEFRVPEISFSPFSCLELL